MDKTTNRKVQADFVARQRARGLRRISVWVPDEKVPVIKEIAKNFAAGKPAE